MQRTEVEHDPRGQRRSLGLFDGLRALFGGVGFIAGTPRLWGYAAAPLAIACLLAFALVWAGWHGAAWATNAMFGAGLRGLAAAGAWMVQGVLVLVALLVALVGAVSLAQPLSGWALGAILRAQEAHLGAQPPQHSPGLVASALRALAVGLLALVVGIPLLALLSVVGILFPPAAVVTFPLKLVVAALLIAWDLLDYPFERRGVGIRARLAWIRRNLGAVLGFGLPAALLMLVPCVGLMLLPMGVAGAARLVVASSN